MDDTKKTLVNYPTIVIPESTTDFVVAANRADPQIRALMDLWINHVGVSHGFERRPLLKEPSHLWRKLIPLYDPDWFYPFDPNGRTSFRTTSQARPDFRVRLLPAEPKAQDISSSFLFELMAAEPQKFERIRIQ